MRKTLVVGAIVVVVIATALTISFAGDRTVTQPMRLHVIELAQTDKVINTGKRGDTSGDLLTFHNAIVNTNGKRIGHDQGAEAGLVGMQVDDVHRGPRADHGRGAVLRQP
jgi:hypothetical protein